MAVLFENDCGWFVDQKLWFDQNCTQDYTVKNDYFEIWEQFLMDSQYVCSSRSLSKSEEENGTDLKASVDRKKKKKRKRRIEFQSETYHSKVKEEIRCRSGSLLDWARQNYFKPNKKAGNNRQARDAALNSVGSKVDMIEVCKSVDDKSYGTHPISIQESDLTVFPCSRLYFNQSDKPAIMRYLDDEFLIPGASKFLLSDIQDCKKLIKSVSPANLIVIDPPWENKSIKRIKKYKTLTDWDMYKLPVKSLSSPSGCLIAVWATNKLKQIKFVKEGLFPFWNVKHIADWHWMKVTRSGDLVCDFNSDQKKPYENIIIGLYESMCETESKLTIPDVEKLQHKIIVSVPSSIHSQKPTLSEIFKPFLKADAVCLELFARYLTPGWISWGNEVLKHQHVDYFEKIVD
ncbi:N(6)-adenine-specific methyltransferase METTL4-like [Tubulanus polymorphus]|uniref:N(6)-adenine-specific methyltransferase METTL4-like n=1 Tax=Tubulanus polymorphus TaxID=672921 RepID=UPI003DA62DA4